MGYKHLCEKISHSSFYSPWHCKVCDQTSKYLHPLPNYKILQIMSDYYPSIHMECYSNVLKKLQLYFQKSSVVNNCRGQHVMYPVVDNSRCQHVMYTNLIHELVPHFLFHIKTKTLGTTTNLNVHVNEWTKHRMLDSQIANQS